MINESLPMCLSEAIRGMKNISCILGFLAELIFFFSCVINVKPIKIRIIEFNDITCNKHCC